MNENTITITLEEYKELLRKAERIATVEKMLANLAYVNVDDIKVALDIQKAKGDKENA
jgi:UDP-3-O-acyl-N-acetylglucosamine deacetylase